MSSLSALTYSALRAMGLPRLVRARRDAAVILCYHNVVDGSTPAGDPGLHLPVAAFQAQIEWLGSHYTIVPLSELLTRLRAGRSLRHLAVLTFDDAYQGFFALGLPLLERRRLPATVFVVTTAADSGRPFWWDVPAVVAAPERRDVFVRELAGDARRVLESVNATVTESLPPHYRPASWDVIRAAGGGDLSIGAHTVQHRALPYIDDVELLREVRDARVAIAQRLGAEPGVLSFPYGLHDARVQAAARDAGYAAALTLAGSLVTGREDPWSLPRVNIPAAIGSAAFEAWVAGLDLRRMLRA